MKILAGICIIHKNKVLLLQQPKNAPHAGKWGPPGGHSAAGETPLETAVRETYEETGIRTQPTSIVNISVIIEPDGESIVIVFYKSALKNPAIKRNAKEVAGFAWVTLAELKKNKYKLREKFLKPILVNVLCQDKIASNDVLTFTDLKHKIYK